MSYDITPPEKGGGGGGGGAKYFRTAKLKEGPVRLRITTPIISGWEGWPASGNPKVVRVHRKADLPDVEWKKEPAGFKEGPKQFWAFGAINLTDGAFQVFVITQSSIITQIIGLKDNPDFGPPTGYDITITRGKDSKGFITYTVNTPPSKPVPDQLLEDWKAVEAEWTGLAALYGGGDPWTPFDESVPGA